MKSTAFDVVVVGGGLAGLACAIRCAEQGITVAVLERGTDELYACNSRFANGFINVGSEYIHAPPGRLRQVIDRQTYGFARAPLAETLSRNAAPAVRWLASQGVRMVEIHGGSPIRRTVLAPPPYNRPGLDWLNRGADRMVRTLTGNFARLGGKLLRGVEAQGLVVEGGRVCGVNVLDHGQPACFHARAVLLADGGFQANEDLLKRYISPAPGRLVQRNAKTGRGDGLRMALSVGAGVVGMDRFYGHCQARDAIDNPLLWPYPVLDAPITAGIAVDARGRRFADEGYGGVYVANMIARLDDPLSAVAIFDDATWQGTATVVTRPPNPFVERVGGKIHRADTIDGLARLAGLPAVQLVATVEEFNKAVRAKRLGELDPPRSDLPYKLPPISAYTPEPLEKPPFYAVPLSAGITYTMGGISIDGGCRVLREDGSVIPGLYAAGSTTGGHEGGPRAGYTGGLSKAMTFGWTAGNGIAAALAEVARAA